MRGKVLPNDYFLTRDKNGNFHWYMSDPLRSRDIETLEVKIEDVISDFVGFGDIANPVMVHLNCAKIDRSEKFNVGLLAGVRSGKENKHFEDYNGDFIDIAEIRNSSAEFPLTGIVYNESGDFVEARRYSFKGECSDGIEEHTLIALSGLAKMDQVPKDEM